MGFYPIFAKAIDQQNSAFLVKMDIMIMVCQLSWHLAYSYGA